MLALLAFALFEDQVTPINPVAYVMPPDGRIASPKPALYEQRISQSK